MAALAAGLGISTDAERAPIAEALIAAAGAAIPDSRAAALWRWVAGAQRPDPAARAADALLACWAALPEAARTKALHSRAELVIRRALHPATGGGSVAAVAREARDPRLLPVLASLLTSDHADAAEEAIIRTAAAIAGLDDARLGLEPSPVRCIPVEYHPAAADALAPIVRSYPQHRREGVIFAAAVALHPGALAYGPRAGLAGWLAEKEDPSHAGLRSAIRRSPGPLWRLRAWEWLSRDAVAAAAMERLASAYAPPEHAAVLENAHLLANPARARRAALIPATALRGKRAILPGPETLARLSPAARRGLARFAPALRLRAGIKERIFEPLLKDTDPATRLAAALELGGTATDALAADPDPRVAGSIALRRMLDAPASILASLSASPHPWVQRLAREQAARTDPWAASPPDERSRFAARRLMAEDRPAFLAELRRRISCRPPSSTIGVPDHQCSAIMLARQLALQSEVELELLAAANSFDDPRVAATAAAALAEAGSDTALQAVRRLAAHAEGRVRANAVEGLVRHLAINPAPAQTELYAAAIELKDDGHHRVRANAIRGLLIAARGYEPAAEEGLASMLADHRPLHRLAALWAAERTLLGPAGDAITPARWNEWSARVAEMARAEPEPPVRARAVRCAARMLSRMRTGWERRAPALEGSA